jgi:hypothetical protein
MKKKERKMNIEHFCSIQKYKKQKKLTEKVNVNVIRISISSLHSFFASFFQHI